MAGSRVRNSRGQGDRLRDEIVQAATALVDDDAAVPALTLRGVARRAGVSAPSIYAHFADVQAVTDAVLVGSFAELDAAVATAMSSTAELPDSLVAGCLGYVRFGWEHRARYRFMLAGSGFAPDAVRTFRRIETALQGCIDAGLSGSTDARTDGFLIWAGMHGMAGLQKPDRPELRRLGPLDRVTLTEAMARRLARLS